MTGARAALAGTCGVVLLGGLAVAPSCAALPSAAECERACAAASRCGLLPSALGGALGEPTANNEQSCVDRCVASEADDPRIASLLAHLGDAELAADDTLCTPDGADRCAALVTALERDPGTSGLDVTTTLTVRMTNLVSHVTAGSPSSWCCFDYAYDLDGAEDGVDEVARVHDMFQPTYDCLAGMHTAATMASEILMDPQAMMDPMDIEAAAAQCRAIVALWRDPAAPGEAPLEPTDDPCTFARQSSRLRGLAVPQTEQACEPAGLDPQVFATLADALDTVMTDWNLQPGGLVGDDGEIRPVEEIRTALQDAARNELAGTDRPLERTCDELFEDLGAPGCDALDLDALAEPPTCGDGPTCSPADCLDESAACDVTLCDLERSPPGRECGLLGVTAVRLGYRNAQGLEVLGEPITGCEALTDVSTTFADVPVGHLVPVAVVSGTLPSFLFPDDDAAGSPFSWIVEGDGRWVTAGSAELEVPSFLVERYRNLLENPLEALRWVPQRYPTGKACNTDPMQCEGWWNGNCDNGIDDDGDGVVDRVSAWCDDMFRGLVDRCIVTPPGQPGAEGCVTEPPS